MASCPAYVVFQNVRPLVQARLLGPLLRQHSDTFPLAWRCVQAACCLTFQNCDVERDLAILRKLQVKTNQQLHNESIDQRAQVRLCGPEADKIRGQRIQGFVREVALCWAAKAARQRAPNPTKKGCPKGQILGRARKRQAGFNRSILEMEVLGELGAESGEENLLLAQQGVDLPKAGSRNSTGLSTL